MTKNVTREGFAAILPTICDSETSADPDGWTPENPLWGHCAVVALIAQDLFGGTLHRASLGGTPYARMRSHYCNRIASDGMSELRALEWCDFTNPQFGDAYPTGLQWEERSREYALSNAKTLARYKEMTYRLARRIHGGNGIFSDAIYRRCFMAALDSPCRKMRFGCVITHQGKAVYEGANRTIEPLASMCAGTCIRFGIASRTESMLGACGHAEEGVWDVVHQGIPINECELYVAGLDMRGLPWLKTAREHTCLRCAAQMYRAKLRGVWVPVINRWEKLTVEEALETARAYATKEKSV